MIQDGSNAMSERGTAGKVSFSRSIILVLLALIFIPLAVEAAIIELLTYTGMHEFFQRQTEANRQIALESAKDNLKNLIEGPYNILSKYSRQSTSTESVEAVIDILEMQIRNVWRNLDRNTVQKRKLILEMVGGTRFGPDGKNYIWINDRKRMLAHPVTKAQGKAIDDPIFNDRREGFSILVRMIDDVLAVDPATGKPKGETQLMYWWPKPGESDPQPKMSYLRYLPELDWFLGGGLYVDETAEVKKRQALEEIRNFRLADGNYFWVNDTRPAMLMHPTRPELEGRYLGDFTDQAGTKVFESMTEVARKNGQGFVEYLWTKPGGEIGREYPKLSFVKYFQPWNLIVGMGVYTDEIDALAEQQNQEFRTALRSMVYKSLFIALLVAAGVFIVTGLVANRVMVRPIASLQRYAARVVSGDLDAEPGRGSFVGELGALRTALGQMVTGLKVKIIEAESKSEEANREADRSLRAQQEADTARQAAQKVLDYQKDEIHGLARVLKAMAQGDLTARYAARKAGEETIEARRSFQDLEQAMNEALDNLGQLMNGIRGTADVLTDSASQFLGVSGDMLDGSESMSRQAGHVAGATEQISTNITAMAAATEQMSANVSNVSSTAEEMSRTMESVAEAVNGMRQAIAAIAANADDGEGVAHNAVGMADGATATMRQLGEAAQEIGKVTEVIKRIAEQTNLLALNATIEAASAGDAGKGFAVVAHEIKELANQSAKAAEDIAAKIEGVQDNTAQAVQVIAEVASIVGAFNESMEVITEAVQRQTAATNEISVSVSETSKGAMEIAVSISELAKGANDMSKNAGEVAKGANEAADGILSVSQAAEKGSGGARRVHDLADVLNAQAGELKRLLSRFSLRKDE